MKTAIKQLFERIRLTYPMIDDDVNEDYWLEKEKEQIIDAYNTWKDPELGNLSGSDYYSKTYE